jgi:uncharacterized membrane protein
MKKLGYFLLALSFLIWGLVLLVPFAGGSAADMAANVVAIYIFSYVIFFAGSLLVGKEAMLGLKNYIKSRRARKASESATATDDASPES